MKLSKFRVILLLLVVLLLLFVFGAFSYPVDNVDQTAGSFFR